MADERSFPDVSFVDTDTEAIMETLQEDYETEFGRALQAADPERLRLLWFAAILSQERSYINIAAKRNLPRYAEGEYLDSLAEIFYGVERLAATPATVTLEFTLSEAVAEDVTIPAGTGVTNSSGTVTFLTVETLTIAAGETSGTVEAECDEDGTAGNGYAAGTLNTIIDPVAYVETVTNTEETDGGTDDESDDALYQRMKESYEAYSTAGTVGSYRYHAMTHNASVADVVVTTPEAGCVDVCILLTGGELPDEETLEDMQDYLRSDEIRPLTDYVTVSAPDVTEFSVALTYYADADSTTSEETLAADVEEAVNDYVTWQTQKLGRSINPSKLIALVVAAGAAAVEVTAPTATDVAETAVGQCSSIQLTYGGTIA